MGCTVFTTNFEVPIDTIDKWDTVKCGLKSSHEHYRFSKEHKMIRGLFARLRKDSIAFRLFLELYGKISCTFQRIWKESFKK